MLKIYNHDDKGMKTQKIYEAGDKMISLIKDNYNLLQSLGSFGINLGFGDKTVDETCKDNGVDTYTLDRKSVV